MSNLGRVKKSWNIQIKTFLVSLYSYFKNVVGRKSKKSSSKVMWVVSNPSFAGKIRHLYWTILAALSFQVLKKQNVKLRFSRSALLLIPIFESNFVQLIRKENGILKILHFINLHNVITKWVKKKIINKLFSE